VSPDLEAWTTTVARHRACLETAAMLFRSIASELQGLPRDGGNSTANDDCARLATAREESLQIRGDPETVQRRDSDGIVPAWRRYVEATSADAFADLPTPSRRTVCDAWGRAIAERCDG
jgi:hypothetical protein